MSRTQAKKKKSVKWTPFEILPLAENKYLERVPGAIPDAIYVNNLYQVSIHHIGGLKMLMVKHRHRSYPVEEWEVLQRIKNEVLGKEVEAVQLYPAETRREWGAKATYLFCLELGAEWPIGIGQKKDLVYDNEDEQS